MRVTSDPFKHKKNEPKKKRDNDNSMKAQLEYARRIVSDVSNDAAQDAAKEEEADEKKKLTGPPKPKLQKWGPLLLLTGPGHAILGEVITAMVRERDAANKRRRSGGASGGEAGVEPPRDDADEDNVTTVTEVTEEEHRVINYKSMIRDRANQVIEALVWKEPEKEGEDNESNEMGSMA